MLLYIVLVILLLLCRLVYMTQFSKGKRRKKPAKTLIVIGSGGHTSEMLDQIKNLDPKLYEPRLYVMAEADNSSEFRIRQIEEKIKLIKDTQYEIVKIPRSRCVSQSYLTSIFTTFYSIVKCLPVVVKFKPDLVLCNGPGTCIPICLVAFFSNVFLFFQTKIVFIESICRVKTLSLSGKILLFIADAVIVQWSDLHKKYPQTVFLGRLA